MLSQLQLPGMPAAQPRAVGESPGTFARRNPRDSPRSGGVQRRHRPLRQLRRPGDWAPRGRWHRRQARQRGYHCRRKYNPERRQPQPTWGAGSRAHRGADSVPNGPVVWSHQRLCSANRLDQLERAPHTAAGDRGRTHGRRQPPSMRWCCRTATTAPRRPCGRNQMFQTMDIHRIDQPGGTDGHPSRPSCRRRACAVRR